MILALVSHGSIGSTARKRILLVEDNFLVGMRLADILQSLGYECVGPVPSVAEAVRLAMAEVWDGAVLDINIIGGSSEPVAVELDRRAVPYFFVTGYSSPLLISEALQTKVRLSKPVTEELLRETMTRQIGA